MTTTQSPAGRQDPARPGGALGPRERLVAVAEILARGLRRALAASAGHGDRTSGALQPPVNTEKRALPEGPSRALMTDEESG